MTTVDLQNYPNFMKVVQNIEANSPFQKKAVRRIVENAQEPFLRFAEDFVTRIIRALDRGESHPYLAKAYLDYTKQIRIEEMFYMKERRYRESDFEKVYKQVYGRKDYMYDYVTGLGLTQLFWPNHWAIVSFFLSEFLPLVRNAKVGAELGVGHGLFHSELLRAAPQIRTKMLDVSETSLAFTRRMVEATGLDPERATPTLGDIQKNIPLEDNSIDALLMGEVIEHLQEGEKVMAGMAKKMKQDGYCFFTTAANVPAEDHILLFRTTGEIRDLIQRTSWKIVKEHVGTLNGMSLEEAERDGHNINYAAVLQVAR